MSREYLGVGLYYLGQLLVLTLGFGGVCVASTHMMLGKSIAICGIVLGSSISMLGVLFDHKVCPSPQKSGDEPGFYYIPVIYW